MPKLKPPTNDEMSRLMVRIEDVQASANEFARRLDANTATPITLPIDRVATVLGAVEALGNLARGCLRGVWSEEQRQSTKKAATGV